MGQSAGYGGMGRLQRIGRAVGAWWHAGERAPGWCLRVSQAPDESIEAAVRRTARAQHLPPHQVLGALVWGFRESDRARHWPQCFEWRRPGYEGPLEVLYGYERARMEMIAAPGGPN